MSNRKTKIILQRTINKRNNKNNSRKSVLLF